MKLVFEDLTERQIKKLETISFFTDFSSIYLIEISARVKGEKQLGESDDEDLKVEIDRLKFPTLSGQPRYLDSPAAFSGGKLHGLAKSVFFFVPLRNGLHEITLTADVSATLEKIQVYKIDTGEEPTLFDIVAEDGDRRPWLTFVFLDVLLKEISLNLILKRRFLDSDDVKVVINDSIKRNYRSILHKFWYFVASLSGEAQSGNFETRFASGPHYVEFWADRSPTLNKITFSGLNSTPIEPKDPTEIIKDKIRYKAREYGFDEGMMLRIAKKESQFNPRVVSPVGAKGIFQLTKSAIDQDRKEGYIVNDVFDVNENIEGAMVHFRYLSRLYNGDEDCLEKTLIAWNWGMRHVQKGESIDWSLVPDETRGFINFVLSR